MAISFTWSINELECRPEVDGKKDFVVVARWQCLGVDEPYRANRHGVCEFSVEDGAAFTPYEALTEQQVLGWVWAKDSKEVVENWIAEAVAAQKNPPAVAQPLPWE